MNKPIESTHLGKPTDYPCAYAPQLLVAVPRDVNRRQFQIEANRLPFIGVDAWHAFEAGFLTDNGLPVVGVLKLIYPCTSPSLVESKSLKLYLNSFNMEKLGPTPQAAATQFVSQVRTDLSKLLNTEVDAVFFAEDGGDITDLDGYQLIDTMPQMQQVVFSTHTESPALLTAQETSQSGSQTIRVCSHLLRSNCKITHQPDWGSAFITMTGSTLPTLTSLLQYLVSFRNEHHFHEEVCEMIYKRLWDIFAPDALCVACIYTRRGGIDICPVRASAPHMLLKHLTSPKVLTRKLHRQ
ncbi:MAG: NADPH-dependent 7-cyano-7-deazaguanine reductase QueF [Deltaproteobacteria bacterium]|nr:NADPH-dependent 7-cyano-7-deazaguanine reductase QueF [Deltaproteobacteria bacterium]